MQRHRLAIPAKSVPEWLGANVPTIIEPEPHSLEAELLRVCNWIVVEEPLMRIDEMCCWLPGAANTTSK
jgi:hypothetical protein